MWSLNRLVALPFCCIIALRLMNDARLVKMDMQQSAASNNVTEAFQNQLNAMQQTIKNQAHDIQELQAKLRLSAPAASEGTNEAWQAEEPKEEAPPPPAEEESPAWEEAPAAPAEEAADVAEAVEAAQPADISVDMSDPRYKFRVDWSNAPVSTPLGKMIEANQMECHASNPEGTKEGHRFYIHMTSRRNGLGNNVHVWSQSLCNAMQRDAMLITRGPWKWSSGLPECDELYAKSNKGKGSSQLWCFFGRHESNTRCANGEGITKSTEPKNDKRIVHVHGNFMPGLGQCDHFLQKHNYTVGDFRAASMEWLFQSLNPNVIEEATRQAKQAFGEEGIPPAENLVTAHIRWGDKGMEMKLLPIEDYVNSIFKMVGEEKANNQENPLHVYASSEDPKAIVAFQEAAPKHWKIHTSGPRQEKGKVRAMIGGQNGLESFGALLVSLEANYYVFTTGSNWSRLINELRKNVINPRCGDCTVMDDLSYGEV